jgi:hypothetical protein
MVSAIGDAGRNQAALLRSARGGRQMLQCSFLLLFVRSLAIPQSALARACSPRMTTTMTPLAAPLPPQLPPRQTRLQLLQPHLQSTYRNLTTRTTMWPQQQPQQCTTKAAVVGRAAVQMTTTATMTTKTPNWPASSI